MARTQIEVRCESWEDVDRLLGEIGGVDIEMQEEELASKARIADIQAQLAAGLEPLASRRKELEAQIYAFMKAHRDDFGKKKSMTLTFGKVDWRDYPARVIVRKGWSVEAVIRRIKEIFAKTWREFVDVKESLNKTKVRGLSDEELAQVGLERTQEKDQPGLSVNYEKVKEALRR